MNNLAFFPSQAYTRITTMSIAESDFLSHPELDSVRMTFDEFHADYCQPESPVIVPHRQEKISVAMTRILFYGQADEIMIIYRGGTHNNAIIPWLATYDLNNNKPTFYDEPLLHQTIDTALANKGGYANIVDLLLTPKNDPFQIVKFRMGGQVLQWTQNDISIPVKELHLDINGQTVPSINN